MRHSNAIRNLFRDFFRCLLFEVPLMLILSAASPAQTFTVVHTFTGNDGSSPYSGVTVDRAGNLYGTTKFGGNPSCIDLGCGTLFKLAPNGSGWTFLPLYQFAGGSDGKYPIARIVFGPDGRLYGTTLTGGTSTLNGGTVFALAPPPTVCRTPCSWIKTTLWSFGQYQNNDGLRPGYGDLVFDSAGNLYGTTEEGGATRLECGPGCGTAYMLSGSQGSWSETLIYQFGDGPGFHPYAGVSFDSNGNLYGTTPLGGTGEVGVAYGLSPSNGSWLPTILYDFRRGNDGDSPAAGLVPDGSGNLYGATYSGGGGGGGTVFELSPMGMDWTLQLLHSFDYPAQPFANLTMDGAGNLYGTTIEGGIFRHGNVFKLTRSGDSWTYTSLYDFTAGSDGAAPHGNVALDAAGNLYGTTTSGGSATGDCVVTHGCGVVWEITP